MVVACTSSGRCGAASDCKAASGRNVKINALYDMKIKMLRVAKSTKPTPTAQEITMPEEEELLTPMPGITIMVEPMDIVADEVTQALTEKSVTLSITNTPEEMSDADVIQPTPGTSKGGVRAQKRKKSYKEPSTSESESHSESTNASKENLIKKRSTREQKKKPAKGQTSATPKDKPQKTRAKDRRKLIDLTNRVRQKGG